MSEHNSNESRKADKPVTNGGLPPGVSFEAVTGAMQVAAKLGYVVIESTKCPHCQHTALYAHLFNERLTCQKCKQSYPSAIPRPPQEGEVTAAHMEAALVTLHRAMKKGQEQYPPMDDATWATYPEFVQTAMKRYAHGEVLKALEKAKELGLAYSEL